MLITANNYFHNIQNNTNTHLDSKNIISLLNKLIIIINKLK